MSEEKEGEVPAEEGNSELDLAIESLLTDLKGQTPIESVELEVPAVETPAQQAQEEIVTSVAIESETAISQEIESSVEEVPPLVVKKKRWIWVLLVFLMVLGGAGFYYYWKVHKTTPTFTLAPPDMSPPVVDLMSEPLVMDTEAETRKELLDSSSDSAAQPSHVSMQNEVQPSHTSTDAHGKAVAAKAQSPSHPAMDAHGKPVAATTHSGDHAAHASIPLQMGGIVVKDSLVIPFVQGKMAEGRVGFHTDVVLYTRKKLRSGLSSGQLESIRVVIQNIFYFTEPSKDQIPEIEQQILQKAGFLLPDGQIFLVSLRNLTMEIPS